MAESSAIAFARIHHHIVLIKNLLLHSLKTNSTDTILHLLRISSLGFFQTILDGLPRLAAADFVEPPSNIFSLFDTTSQKKLRNIPLDIRPAVNKVAVSSRVELGTVGKVEEVNERELVTRNILLFAQNLLINIELGAERVGVLFNLRFVGC